MKKRPSKSDSKSPSKGGSLANIAAMSGSIDATPDIIYKMSKKIAQLTKVIYYLNTKHEDHEAEIHNLTDAYESEIDRVSKELIQGHCRRQISNGQAKRGILRSA